MSNDIETQLADAQERQYELHAAQLAELRDVARHRADRAVIERALAVEERMAAAQERIAAALEKIGTAGGVIVQGEGDAR